MSTAGIRLARSLAAAHGHTWAAVPDRVLDALDRYGVVDPAAQAVAVGAWVDGNATPRTWQAEPDEFLYSGEVAPVVTDGCFTHRTGGGRGRLLWAVSPDGQVDLSVYRPQVHRRDRGFPVLRARRDADGTWTAAPRIAVLPARPFYARHADALAGAIAACGGPIDYRVTLTADGYGLPGPACPWPWLTAAIEAGDYDRPPERQYEADEPPTDAPPIPEHVEAEAV